MAKRVQALLLVLIGMVGILLLMPAIVRLREVYKYSNCQWNLRTIALAAHKYHEDHHCLPPGWLGSNPDKPGIHPAPHVGTMAYLLPYLTGQEKNWEAPYFQADVRARTEPPTDPESGKPYTPSSDIPWWQLTNPVTGRTNKLLATQQFPFLLCPSADRLTPSDGWIVAMNAYGVRREYFDGFLQREVLSSSDYPDLGNLGVTHYLGVAGCFGSGDKYVGIFTNRSRLTLGQITVCDGTSNTLFFGEAIGGYKDGSAEVRSTSYSWFCGALPTYYGLPTRKQNPWFAFNGPHVGRVNFAYADGSVRGIRRIAGADDFREGGDTAQIGSSGWRIFQQLAGYKDGEAY